VFGGAMHRVSTIHMAIGLATGVIVFGVVQAWSAAGNGDDKTKPILSGRWQLNRDLSEDADRKLRDMREGMAGSAGDHGGGMGRGGGMGGGGGMGPGGGSAGGMEQMRAQMEEAQRMLKETPSTVVIMHEDPKLTVVDGDGRQRTLYTDKRKVTADGHEVKTKWDRERVVAETKVGESVKVIETYELAPDRRQLVVDMKMEISMMGRSRSVSIRRVYDKTSE